MEWLRKIIREFSVVHASNNQLEIENEQLRGMVLKSLPLVILNAQLKETILECRKTEIELRKEIIEVREKNIELIDKNLLLCDQLQNALERGESLRKAASDFAEAMRPSLRRHLNP